MLGQAAEVAAAVVRDAVAAGAAGAAVRDAVAAVRDAAEEAASANEVAVPALVAVRVAALVTAVTDVGRVAAALVAAVLVAAVTEAAVTEAAEEYDNTVQTGVFLKHIALHQKEKGKDSIDMFSEMNREEESNLKKSAPTVVKYLKTRHK